MERGQRQSEIFSELRGGGSEQIEWQEKRVELMEQLDQRLNLAEKLVQITEEVNEDTPADSLNVKLNSFITEIEQQTPESVKQQVAEAVTLFGKIEALREKIVTGMRTDITPEQVVENNRVIDELNNLEPDFYALLDNPSNKFFFDLKNMVTGLQSKMKWVSKIGKDEESVFQELANAREADVEDLKSHLDVKEIKFGPYWVTLVVEDLEDFYGSDGLMESEGMVGLYTRGSPFIIVEGKNKAPEEIEDSEKHERVHLLLDGSQHFIEASMPTQSLTYFNQYASSNTASTNELYARPRNQIVGRPTTYNPVNFFNRFHNELLAEDEVGELQRYFQKEKFYEPRKLTLNELQKMVPMLMTAGGDFADSISILRRVQKHNIDPEITAIATKLDKGLVAEFQNSLGALGYAYNITARMGDRAQRDAEILTYILLPSQYHHIPGFLAHKYGEAAIKKASDSAKQAYEFNPYRAEALSGLIEHLEKNPNQLSDIDKKLIRDKLEGLDGGEVVEQANITRLNQIRRFMAQLKQLGSLLEAPRIGEMAEKVFYVFIAIKIIDPNWKNKPEKLLEVWQNLDNDEKAAFKESFLDSFGDVMLDELQETKKLASLKKSKLWKVIEGLNFASEVEKILEPAKN